MKKIWAKIILENNLIDEYVLNLKEFYIENFYDYLKEICYNLKIETPIILPKHNNQLSEFNVTIFYKEDFIDFVDFDNLTLEYFEL